MLQEVESPGYETRLAILKKKSEGMDPPVRDNTLKFIAANIKSHVRAMEGALSKVNIYAKNGLTLTDAVNVFFQQSLNAGGFPFPVTEDNAEIIKAKALSRLMKELQKGDDCTELYDAAEARKLLNLGE